MGLQSLDRRRAWDADFGPFIRSLDEQKMVIWAGESGLLEPVKERIF